MTSTPRLPDGKSPKILCIGMPVRDLIYRIKDLPGRGEKVRAEHFEELAGGNALNAAIGIVRLGGRALFSGPMGDAAETSSRYIFEQLAKEGIDANVVHMAGIVTPVSNVMIDPSGERTVVTYRDPKLWNVKLPDTNDLLAGCAAVLTENRCAGFATELCVEASRRNIPVVLDADTVMSMREGLFDRGLAHHLFRRGAGGHGRHRESRGRVAADRRADQIVPGRNARCARHDVAWMNRAARRRCRHSRSIPSTRWAPATFSMGAFALAITEGRPIADAMRFASAAAALKCTRFGGAFAAPDRGEVEALLSQGTAKIAEG